MSESFGGSGQQGSELKRSVLEASQRIESIIDSAEAAAAEIRAEARVEAEREASLIHAESQRSIDRNAQEMAQIVAPLTDRLDALRREVGVLTQEIDVAASKLRQLAALAPAAPVVESPAAPDVEPAAAEPVESPAAETSEAGTAFTPKAEPTAPEPVAAEPEPPPASPFASAESSEAPPGPAPVAYPGTGQDETAVAPQVSTVPEEALLRATQMAVSGSPRDEIVTTLQSEFGLADAGAVVDDILGAG